MKRELGDVLWYWVQGCIALGFTPHEVMDENIQKIKKKDIRMDLKLFAQK